MLKIIESILTGPCRFIYKESGLERGTIVQLKEVDGIPTCVSSDGTRPFGIVDDFGVRGLIAVWFDSMIVRTDNFDHSERYAAGDALYVNQRGRLTVQRPFEEAYLVGHVISGPAADRSYIDLNWI